jgi:predicted nuclease of predicted toxin-antitoxin system
MKFIVDVQLPYSVAGFLKDNGFDALHTNDLPDKERICDNYIRELSQRENRTVITKDRDFIDSFVLKSVPEKLLVITTGNIRNKELLSLLKRNLNIIIKMFKECNLIEMNNDSIVGQ